jgi:hypothetical protein
MVLGLRIDKLYFYLLTSGTGYHGQAMLAYSSMPYLNVGDYNGWDRAITACRLPLNHGV